MEKLFGTDGIRGVAGRYPLNKDMIRKAGFVAAAVIASKGKANNRTNGAGMYALMGRDSRKSGVEIGRFLAEGMNLAGVKIADMGIIPTPAVAYLASKTAAVCGVVVSASHNPPEFNGIKFFSSEGFKLEDEIEREIEAKIFDLKLEIGRLPAAVSAAAGYNPVIRHRDAVGMYAEFIRSTMPADVDFSGLKIVLDCANGAAYKIAPMIFRALNAQIRVIGCRPDGGNINLGCGALDTAAMRKETVRWGADCGISLDGDADRAVFADENGAVFDGDDVMAMAAGELHSANRLRRCGVVVTVMSNYGLLQYLEALGIKTVQVPVGDKNVTAALEKERLSLGGEASGHIIFRDFAPTGDGILTAVQTLCIMKRAGRSLGFFRKKWKRCPQILESVKVSEKIPVNSISGFSAKINRLEKSMGGKGRIFVRYSGTEPLLRVLVEGPSKKQIAEIARELIEHYKKYLEAGK